VLLLGKNLIFGTDEGCKYQIKKKELLGLIAIVALIYLYVLLMRFGGFLVITPIIIFVLMKLTGSARIREAIIVSISATVLIYLLFDVIFNVQLPGGLLM
jgi:putative tricarboxylic transport membrane protein